MRCFVTRLLENPVQHSLKFSLAIAFLALPTVAAPLHAETLDCGNWLSEEFFTKATFEDVQKCVDNNDMSLNPTDESRLTPLHIAARYDADPAVIEGLVNLQTAATYDVNPFENGYSIKSSAVVESATVVESSAVVNSRDAYGLTPLHFAVAGSENPEVIDVLQRYGADPNSKDEYGLAPLHIAARFTSNPQVIEKLVSLNAATNAKDIFGLTPLHWAAVGNENREVIDVLLRLGADPNLRDLNGRTPLDIALEQDNDSVISLLNAIH